MIDFGIRGFDLTYALLDDYDAAILVDAAPRGGPPGTLYVIEPDSEVDPDSPDVSSLVIDAHVMDPVKVLRLASAMAANSRKRVLLVGCEPATFGTDDDPAMGLSAPVAAAVDEAIRLIDSLVERSSQPITMNRTRPLRQPGTTERKDLPCWNESPAFCLGIVTLAAARPGRSGALHSGRGPYLRIKSM